MITKKGRCIITICIEDSPFKFCGNPVLKISGYCERAPRTINKAIEATDAMICEGLNKMNVAFLLLVIVLKIFLFIILRFKGVLMKTSELKIRKK